MTRIPYTRRAGALGDAMEAAEVDATTAMARACRVPQDYALWAMIGRLAVEAATRMTQEQRAVFVATLERGVDVAREQAMTNAPGRLAAALGVGHTRPIFGFDDED
jgi:hypothetical protein